MKNNSAIKVLIVDDHPMIRDGIRFTLQSSINEMPFETDEAENGEEAIDKVKTNAYDLVIIDYQMPGENGDRIVEKMLSYKPELKILAVSNYDQLAYIKKMMAAGAKGYILKNIEPTDLFIAIKTLLEGRMYYSNEVAIRLLEDHEHESVNKSNKYGLSDRQLEILKLIAEEKTSEEIAASLFLSKRTVDTHRQRIMQKVQAKNTVGLIKVAYELKLIKQTNK